MSIKRKKPQDKLRAQAPRTGRDGVPVNPGLLAPDNSYGIPDYVERGYYVDRPFLCKDCGIEQIWTASQQKWWYEVAKGGVWTDAIRCRKCRRRERERKAQAREVHLAGVARKGRAP